MESDLSTEIMKFEGLFNKVLSCCFVSKNDAFYDDYLQVLRLDACKWLEEQPEASREESEGYLFNRFSWLIRDTQRKNWRNLRLQQKLAQEKPEISYAFDEEELEIKELLAELQKLLTERERQFLYLRLKGMNMTDIANNCGVSRQNVYKWQGQVQKKFEKVFQKG